MNVTKRDNHQERVDFNKITARIQHLVDMDPPLKTVDATIVAQKVIAGIYDGVTTVQLDTLAAETSAYMATDHPDYGHLASRIAISNLQKQTLDSFSQTMKLEYEYINPKTGENSPLLADDVFEVCMKHATELDSMIDYRRDYNYDFFGFRTLERAYLVKLTGIIVERPQHMIMRVSVGIHKDDLLRVKETYDLMSNLWFTHATPTLFNGGTPRPQLSSCFLLTMQEDSIEGIYDTLKQCALISKSAGGIGLSVHNIRAANSYIKGTNGTSNGLIPMLKVFNDTARYVDQGGGKRKGAFAIYLEPWHADVFEFLDLRKNTGKDEARARDLFYAMWISDIFMKRVEENGVWSLFCPNEAPGLPETWGDEFEKLYLKYEAVPGLAKKTVKAQELWFAILESQIETGTPYMMFKDACNRKSNQKNLGTIKSSNLCTEIVEYTSKDEVAVCNLASIALPKFVTQSGTFDFEKLVQITKVITKNLNKIIDINYYPVVEAKNSNLRHRPIGLGVQGLADVFLLMKIPFDSEEAARLNREIFEAIYFGAVESSCEEAEKFGYYSSFPGSPASQGILQFDMWNVTPTAKWDWDSLKKKVVKFGLRNSLLVAPMPTASTSQILGNNEAIEPYTSNIYTRRVLAGEFVMVNRHLQNELMEIGLWNPHVTNKIIGNQGSVQNIDEIPADIKERFKTVWEIKGRVLIDMAADRGAYIDQSQSLNAFIGQPDFAKLTSMHFYSWKKGLKTGMYYLRSRPAVDAIQFTVDKAALEQTNVTESPVSTPVHTPSGTPTPSPSGSPVKKQYTNEEIENFGAVCTMQEGCLSCGS